MTHPLPSLRVQPAVPRRSFLRYTGASVALGSLWLASCSKKDDPATPAPGSLSFSPASGMPGATITLTGTNLAGATAVLLGTTATTFVVVNATTITFTVPAGAASGSISVTTPAGTGTSSGQFTVTAAPAAAPTITSFTPTSALPGATITLTGTNFTGVTAVTVAGLAVTTLTVVNATTLLIGVPFPAQPTSAPVSGAIVVTAAGGTGTSATVFTILPTTLNVGTGDAGVLNYAYALEQLEAAFYDAVRAGSYYLSLATGSAERLILDDLYYHEVTHREFFRAAIAAAGVTPLPALAVNFSSIDFSSRTAVLTTAKAFEDLGVAAYNGAGQYISAPAYLLIAGKIVSVEARHAAIIRDLVSESSFVANDVATLTTAGSSAVANNNSPAGSSLERALSPAEVVAVANTYLALGSKLDVSGLR